MSNTALPKSTSDQEVTGSAFLLFTEDKLARPYNLPGGPGIATTRQHASTLSISNAIASKNLLSKGEEQ
ncbi:138_t:CDS:2, partial [Ambispora gerdemannii]